MVFEGALGHFAPAQGYALDADLAPAVFTVVQADRFSVQVTQDLFVVERHFTPRFSRVGKRVVGQQQALLAVQKPQPGTQQAQTPQVGRHRRELPQPAVELSVSADGAVQQSGEQCVRCLPCFAVGSGQAAERRMLLATGGVNTHKGAIFTLGVLCGAIGRLWTAEKGFPDVDSILNEAAAMTRETLAQELPAARWNTAGEGLYQKYGVRGIRGQVAERSFKI